MIDRSGIHDDAPRPSDLETLLATAAFPPQLLARAAALRRRVVAAGLTKYNVGARGWTRPPGAQRVVLVPGQVESDASLAFDAPGIRTNLALLRAAREAEPEAALDALAAWKAWRGGGTRWWQETYRFYLRRFIEVR